MSIRLNHVFKVATIVVAAGFAVAACERGSPTDPGAVANGVGPSGIEPLAALGSAAYPGVKVAGKVTVCKNAASPAGTYNFTASASTADAGDLISANFSLTAGTCAIVWERTSGVGGSITNVTVTEVIPGASNYALDHINLWILEDGDGFRRRRRKKHQNRLPGVLYEALEHFGAGEAPR